mmetsp:Transcript_30700/g.77605  ORF Transcript_30700/g.77605 Transcript_30700/m.77605 type:complete len:267 (-) Transcript_30700:764-1564(-)
MARHDHHTNFCGNRRIRHTSLPNSRATILGSFELLLPMHRGFTRVVRSPDAMVLESQIKRCQLFVEASNAGLTEGLGHEPAPGGESQKPCPGLVRLPIPCAILEQHSHLLRSRAHRGDAQRRLVLVVVLRGAQPAHLRAAAQESLEHLWVALGDRPEKGRVCLHREMVADAALICNLQQEQCHLGLGASAGPIDAVALRAVAEVEEGLKRSTSSEKASEPRDVTLADGALKLAAQPDVRAAQLVTGHHGEHWLRERRGTSRGCSHR